MRFPFLIVVAGLAGMACSTKGGVQGVRDSGVDLANGSGSGGNGDLGGVGGGGMADTGGAGSGGISGSGGMVSSGGGIPGSGGAGTADAGLICPDQVPRMAAYPYTPESCPESQSWGSLRCAYAETPPGTASGVCNATYQCRCISGQGGSPTCTWSMVSETCPDAGVYGPCSGPSCGSDGYCRAGCCTTVGCVQPPSTCQPLPAACNGTPTCQCVCGNSLCVIANGVVQCPCA